MIMPKLKEVPERYCVAEREAQYLLFDSDIQLKNTDVLNVNKAYYYPKDNFVPGFFQIQNRRYLGNKYKR